MWLIFEPNVSVFVYPVFLAFGTISALLNGIISPAILSGPVWPALMIALHFGRIYVQFPPGLPILIREL